MDKSAALIFITLIGCAPVVQREIPIEVAKNHCQVTEVRSSSLMTVAYLTCNLDGTIVFPVLTSGTSQAQIAGRVLQAGAIIGAGALISGIDTGSSVTIPPLGGP